MQPCLSHDRLPSPSQAAQFPLPLSPSLALHIHLPLQVRCASSFELLASLRTIHPLLDRLSASPGGLACLLIDNIAAFHWLDKVARGPVAGRCRGPGWGGVGWGGVHVGWTAGQGTCTPLVCSHLP